jgi:hypothetical protein
MRPFRAAFALTVAAALSAFVYSCANQAANSGGSNIPPTPSSEPTGSDCLAPDKWFVNGRTPKVEGADFPSAQEQDECPFYKWAWQSFLYLTQSENAGEAPRFALFDTPNDLFPDVTAAPAKDPRKKNVISLSVRNSPNTTRNIQAKAIFQAGSPGSRSGSQGLIVDQNNRCLYYGQHINPEFVSFVRTTADPSSPPSVSQPLGLKNAADIANVPATAQFPPGCVELKSAWRVLTDAERQPDALAKLRKTFFITEALVPTLIDSVDASGASRIIADANHPRLEMVALVGLHVVGTTPGHPEFVWASFEHVENAPTQWIPLDNKESVSDKPFSFYREGTLKSDSNRNPVIADALTWLDPDHTKQTLRPVVDIYREFPSGEDEVPMDPDVKSLNQDVQTKLKAIPSLAVWSNYQLIGAVWLKDPQKGLDPTVDLQYPSTNKKIGEMFAGEKKLSNTTMETFTQHTQFNCFGCHNPSETSNESNTEKLRGSKTTVSHVLTNAYFNRQH